MPGFFFRVSFCNCLTCIQTARIFLLFGYFFFVNNSPIKLSIFSFIILVNSLLVRGISQALCYGDAA